MPKKPNPKQPTRERERDVANGLYEMAQAIRYLADKLSWLDTVGQLLSVSLIRQQRELQEDRDDADVPF